MQRDSGVLKSLVVEMGYALKLLHEAGVVHSDIKTENILVRLK